LTAAAAKSTTAASHKTSFVSNLFSEQTLYI